LEKKLDLNLECIWCVCNQSSNCFMFVDRCIIVQFLRWKTQQDATVYQSFISPYFKWSSTCFGWHTAHHQEPKTAQAVLSSWWWTLSGTVCAWQRPPTTRPTTFHVCKTRGCQCSFRFLMMGGVSPKTCWASYKYGIIKF
jgi:hypothetical protein